MYEFSLALRNSFICSFNLLHAHERNVQQVGPHSDKGTCSYKWIKVCGFKYALKDVVCLKESDLLPQFGRIVNISFQDADQSCLFQVKIFQTLVYHDLMHAYSITITDEYQKISFYECSEPLVTTFTNKKLHVEYNLHN